MIGILPKSDRISQLQPLGDRVMIQASVGYKCGSRGMIISSIICGGKRVISRRGCLTTPYHAPHSLTERKG